MTNSHRTRHTNWFLISTAVFITALLTSNIIAVKMTVVCGMPVTAGIVIFPISYIAADMITEIYGYARLRMVIWLGFICNLLAVGAIALASAMPSAPFWNDQAAFTQILGATPRLLLASFTAYLAGEFSNSYIMAKMKVATDGKYLWMRSIGSTLIGELLDSAIFMTIGFYGIIPPQAMAAAIVTQWLMKSLYEASATPLLYAAVRFLKKKEGIDHYDRDTNFNPLKFLPADQ